MAMEGWIGAVAAGDDIPSELGKARDAPLLRVDITRDRIDGEPAGTVNPEEDWPPAGTTDAEWAEELAALEDSHRRLKATLKARGDERLTDPVAGSDPTVRGLLFGLLQHNAYHAGQVILLKKALAAEVGAG